MRKPASVPLSMLVVVVGVALTTLVEAPRLGVGTAVAAPAQIETAFRDLPTSIITGETLKLVVDAPGGATCDGSIVYRDNSTQTLKRVDEAENRCSWDVVVPETTRRGEADITVTVREGAAQARLTATIDVLRVVETAEIAVRARPGKVRQGGAYSLRLDVPNGASCHGLITYADDRTQELHAQIESKERCRWDLTAPADAARGTARARIAVVQESRQTSVTTSFEVTRDKDEDDLRIAFQDLPSSARRDSVLPIRVLAPSDATCSGEVSFKSAENAKLSAIEERGGLCRWSVIVPKEAKRGDVDVQVKVRTGGKEAEITGVISIEGKAGSDVRFVDLPRSVRRGDELEVKVEVPDGASCQGEITFDDGGVVIMPSQSEKKDRCEWAAKVSKYVLPGPAVVRVWVDDDGRQTTLVGNVRVEGPEDEVVETAAGISLPKQTRLGDSFEVSARVGKGSTCSGKVTYAEGLRWTLSGEAESDGRCTWSVPVPLHATPGPARVEIKAAKQGETDTMTAEIQVRAP